MTLNLKGSTELFRREAIDFQSDRLYGEVILSTAPQLKIYSYLILAVMACACVLLITASFTRKETVFGVLTPKQGIAKISASQPGIIDNVTVVSGQHVGEGDPLLVIRDDSSLKSGQTIGDALRKELERQISLNAERLQSIAEEYRQADEQVAHQTETLEREMVLLDEQKRVSQARHELIADEAAKMSRLRDNKLASDQESNVYLERELQLLSDLKDVERLVVAKSQEIESLRFRRKRLIIEEREARHGLEVRLSELRERAASASLQSAIVVRAPRSGNVNNLQVKHGQSVQAGQVLLSILPLDGGLEVELYLPSRASGFVDIGQSVKLRYAAFPFQKFGVHAAEVKRIENDLILPSDNYEMPYPLKEPVYRVAAELASQSVSVYGQSRPLKAGMELEADIQLSKRSIIEWIFEPVFTLKGRI